jgi:hypothetical protein
VPQGGSGHGGEEESLPLLGIEFGLSMLYYSHCTDWAILYVKIKLFGLNTYINIGKFSLDITHCQDRKVCAFHRLALSPSSGRKKCYNYTLVIRNSFN